MDLLNKTIAKTFIFLIVKTFVRTFVSTMCSFIFRLSRYFFIDKKKGEIKRFTEETRKVAWGSAGF